ncbi:MAG: ABC transporter substrate-binding protein [Bacteroidetes bacterium]|nr:ABC transporter substrate-binding protein [Bacteroidota bacterium]
MKHDRICKRFLFLTVGLILILNGCKKNESSPENPVVQVPIGLALSLTGNFSPYGIIQKNGLTMAINELNNGSNMPGFKFIPFFMDDKSSPDACMQIYRDMIFKNKALIIIGPTSSNCAFPADTIAQNNKVVVMGISNTVPGITEMGNYVFRNSLPESAVIPNTVQVTHAKLGYSKVAIVYGNDDPYTIGAYNAFKASLESIPGMLIVSTGIIHKGDTLFTDQLNQVKAANPDVIVFAALVNEASLLMVQARQLGIPHSVRFIGGNSFNTSKLWQQAGQAAQGSICGSAWIYSGDTPGNAQFVASYSSLYGSKPDQFAAQAYASLYIVADALVRTNSLNNETLRNSLANTTNLKTILGTFSFDANRNPAHTPVVQELDNGEFVLFR